MIHFTIDNKSKTVLNTKKINIQFLIYNIDCTPPSDANCTMFQDGYSDQFVLPCKFISLQLKL